MIAVIGLLGSANVLQAGNVNEVDYCGVEEVEIEICFTLIWPSAYVEGNVASARVCFGHVESAPETPECVDRVGSTKTVLENSRTSVNVSVATPTVGTVYFYDSNGNVVVPKNKVLTLPNNVTAADADSGESFIFYAGTYHFGTDGGASIGCAIPPALAGSIETK